MLSYTRHSMSLNFKKTSSNGYAEKLMFSFAFLKNILKIELIVISGKKNHIGLSNTNILFFF